MHAFLAYLDLHSFGILDMGLSLVTISLLARLLKALKR